MHTQKIALTTPDLRELMQELLAAGLSYRYAPNRFAALNGGGHPFPSPTSTVTTPAGDMIEEGIQPVLSPIVLPQARHDELQRIAAVWPRFLRAQFKLYQQAREGAMDPDSCQLIKALCTAEEWERGIIDPGYPTIHPFVRLDAVLTPNGFKVIDINTTRPAGVGDLIISETVLHRSLDPGIDRFNTGKWFAGIVRKCIDNWAAKKRLPGESIRTQIVIRPDDGDFRNFERLCQCLNEEGLPSSLVTPEQLVAEPSAIIRSRIKEGSPAYEILKRGYPENRCVMSPLYRRFLGNKQWMYLYRTEPFRSLFMEALGEDYAVLDSAFPPIGIIRKDYVQLPENRLPLRTLSKNNWVIKDPASSSGRRMCLGYTMTDRKWQEVLWQDVQEGWIAQQFYPATELLTTAGPNGESVERKLFTKYGIYIFGCRLAGVEFNAREFPVVHGARNTYFNAVFFKRCATTQNAKKQGGNGT